ncbi:MAG: DEAD/DEAH box helicase [Actinomycetota bacterium]
MPTVRRQGRSRSRSRSSPPPSTSSPPENRLGLPDVDLAGFQRAYPFPFDDFQVTACRALAEGRSVLVCAPTGAGKTVVGEFAVWAALQRGTKCFYTTPIKALSNQKFGDFIARHGAANVGLLTGDNSINGEAPVVVMTTEVLRNMIYEASPTLNGLGYVVMDEVHYLKDQYRGAVWEEILIQLDEKVQFAALSATVSNAEEFGEWLSTVRGATDVVITEKRPVPLDHYLMAGDKLVPMFIRDGDELKPNPSLRRLSPPAQRQGRDHRRGPPRRSRLTPDRTDVVERLNKDGMLPAIYFIFSRAGCDQSVRLCLRAGIRLVDAEERERIREYVEMRTALLPVEDHAVLGYDDWVEGLLRGVAAHHAGLIPLFKETVEELFERGLVKSVFATETLALGINMPAKTVVIERLMKFTGERHELLTPGDFTQLTGRAGRRGIDPVGNGIVLFQSDVPPDRIVHLASTRTYPLQSSFRPSYNMAVNLVRRYTIEDAERLLNLSFAQFLTDRSVTRQERQIERNERFLAGYRENMTCDRGDVAEYWELVKRARGVERSTRKDGNTRRREQVASLRPGLVVDLHRGRMRGRAAIVDVHRSGGGQPQVVVVAPDGRAARLGMRDFGSGPDVVGEIKLPRGDRRSRSFRAEVAKRLSRLPEGDEIPREGVPDEPEPSFEASSTPWNPVREHPVHGCPDREEHERWADRHDSLQKETEALRKVVTRRTETLARTFDRVLEVLRMFGYVEEDRLTDKGERLCRIYNESDLLVAEALAQGTLDDLDVADLAAIASTLVYDPRGFEVEVRWPADRVRRAFGSVMRSYRRVHEAEEAHRIELCREPEPGFAEQIWWWAKDEPLEEVLSMGELSAGDFVRSTKQVWDLLRQLAEVAPSEELAVRCRQAAKAVYRGVVAYSGAI